jgi:DNA primase small subunit
VLTADFIEKTFHEYYMHSASSVVTPIAIGKREFGFVLPKQGMLRHKRYKDKSELETFLKLTTPLDVYYSCAYYEDPEVEMDKKGWLGADLIFDIDADHIPTTCEKIHDDWACTTCGFSGKGWVPEKCPACGSQKLSTRTWLCEECLNSAKTETIKLLDMLERDFGFTGKDVHVFFSGHRGYHVHVESEDILDLDSFARREIVDYVCGIGIGIVAQELNEKNWNRARFLKTLSFDRLGWQGRILKGVYELISDEQSYSKLGLSKPVTQALVSNKDMILANWGNKNPWPEVPKIGFETWKKLFEFSAKSQSANVDTVVTTDVHRLIRTAGTLHSKTGLLKAEFSASSIEDFNPFKSAVAFKKGVSTVLVSDAPKFKIGDKTFGPFKNQKVELPLAAALLLVCKGRAEVIE